MNLNSFNNLKQNSLKQNLGQNNSQNAPINFLENFINELKGYLLQDSNYMYTLDRIEGNFAILEDRITKKFSNVPLSNIPPNAKEGDILSFSNGSYSIDSEETKNVSDRIDKKFDNFKKQI